MDSKNRSQANLKKYIKVAGKWQFVPVLKQKGIPVPAVLIRRLAARRKQRPGSVLIFPSLPHPTRPNYGGDKPDAHHLELCKEIAWRAHLNCRRCVTSKGKCSAGPHCRKWDLHKWRHTFATNMLQSGIDIKTLQEQLGHKNIATTEKYLRSLRIESLRSKIEASSIAALLG